MDKYNDYLCIPVELLTFALRNKKVNQVRLFVCLKSLYPSGRFKFDEENIKAICKLLHCHTKSFNANFQWLASPNRKWVTFNKDYCQIKGFKKILIKINYSSRKCAIYYPNSNFINFRAFAYGSVITYYMKLKRKMERRPGMYKERAVKRRHPFSVSYTLPNLYLAKCLGISKSCAINYKKIAEDSGYINVRKRFHDFNGLPDHFKLLKKYTDESIAKKLRNLNGIIAIQLPDEITSAIIIKKKHNLRTLKPKKQAA